MYYKHYIVYYSSSQTQTSTEMFACIYFKKDSSIGVVGHNNKNLKVLSKFEEKNNVEMYWKINGKLELYHGEIVKVHGEYAIYMLHK